MSIKHFWISPAVANKSNQIKSLEKFFPYLIETNQPQIQHTLYILPPKEVESSYQTEKCCITPTCLSELTRNLQIQNSFIKLFPNSFTVFPFKSGDQFISFCLLDMKIMLPCGSGSTFQQYLDNAIRMIKLLGGSITNNITEATVDIEYFSASEHVWESSLHHIPIITPQWLDNSYDSVSRINFNNYFLPLFAKCTFTSTDLPPKISAELSQQVKNGGGFWSKVLDDQTTFLISSSITNSKKCQLALRIGIIIIKPEWIIEINNQQSVINPKNYILNWWVLPQTTNYNFFAGFSFWISDTVPLAHEMIEAIKIAGGTIELSNPQTASFFVIGDGETCQFSSDDHLNDTSVHENNKNNQNNQNKNKCVSPEYIWNCLVSKKLLNIDDFILYRPFSFNLNPEYSNTLISIIGFSNDIRNKLSDIIRRIGLQVSYTPSSRTSIIISESSKEINCHSQQFTSQGSLQAPIVSLNWLIDFAKSGNWPDPQNYSLSIKETPSINDFHKSQLRTHYNVNQYSVFNDFSQNSQCSLPSSEQGEFGYIIDNNIKINQNSDTDSELSSDDPLYAAITAHSYMHY